MKFKEYLFGDLVEKWIDNRGKTPPLSDIGIPLLEVKHLPVSGIYPLLEGTKYVSQSTYDSWFRAYLDPNDILFSTVGTTARVSLTPEKTVVAIAQNVLGIRFKKDIVNPLYMFYYMRARQFQHDIDARLVTTVQASIKRADMVGIPVKLPNLEQQQKIAKKAVAFDYKINLNRQTNQTLETIAQTLFKSWFVDFDPVKAKLSVLAAGGSAEEAERAAMCAISARDEASLNTLQTEQPEAYAELARTAALFPSAMQDSELGEIPVGWEVGVVGDLFELHRGFDLPKKERSEGCYPVFAAGGYHGQHSEYKIKPPGIITGRSGVIGNVYLTLENYWPLNTTLYIRNFKHCGPYYAYFFLKNCDLKSINSGSAVPSLNRNFVHSMPCIISSKNLLDKFDYLVNVHFSKIKLNDSEIRHLSELRDTLIPKLLSGELTLPNTTPPKANPPESDTLEGQQSQQPLMEAAG